MTVTRTDLIDRNGDRMTRIGFPNAAYESFAEAPRQMIVVHFGPADFAEMARSKSPRLRMFAEQAGYKKPRRHAEDDGGQRDEMIDQLRRLGAADEVIQSMPTDALAEMLRLCSGGQGAA